MKAVILGASGNIGTALREWLTERQLFTDIVAVARRMPSEPSTDPRVTWHQADTRSDDLVAPMIGADVVVNLTWLFHPSHDADQTWDSNVGGTYRVLDAVAAAKVASLVHVSSIAAYSPKVDDEPIDEGWPTGGASSAAYSREKAYVERVLDIFERDVPDCRVVRVRPAFVFHRRAATQQRRLFAGPFVPGSMVRPRLLPAFPYPAGLRLQTVHSDDVASAVGLAMGSDVRGSLNLCADEVIGSAEIAQLLRAKPLVVPPSLVKATLRAAWTAHLVPADPQLFDALMRLPVMSNATAKRELGWEPLRTAQDALGDFLVGLRTGSGHPTPPLDSDTSGRLRGHEIATGVGNRD